MDILIMAVLSGVAQLSAHYLPWKLILGRQLRRTEAYMIGVVLMMVPFSVWLGQAGLWRVLLALWVVIVVSGVTVIGAYALDAYLAIVQLRTAEQAENRNLRESVFNDPDDDRR